MDDLFNIRIPGERFPETQSIFFSISRFYFGLKTHNNKKSRDALGRFLLSAFPYIKRYGRLHLYARVYSSLLKTALWSPFFMSDTHTHTHTQDNSGYLSYSPMCVCLFPFAASERWRSPEITGDDKERRNKWNRARRTTRTKTWCKVRVRSCEGHTRAIRWLWRTGIFFFFFLMRDTQKKWAVDFYDQTPGLFRIR